MTDIGKAYVQIVPSAQGITGSITNVLKGESANAGRNSGEGFAKNFVGKLKSLVAAAGIGAIVKSALEEGGKIQQSFGGLDTIYEDAGEAAKQYAQQAYQMGISANDYAEQAVSFGAALKQAYGGDTSKAMEAANTAIMDMTDNAAKMGTPIESIQSAYQGFAKQNYTMLDNLKLGYGGTKSEMERLLKDAQKISGVKYDIGNLGDVYDAIHVIQGDLGLTGVAAQEAEGTFSGSMGAMKAAVSNFMAALTLGQDIQGPLNNLAQTVNNFVVGNLFPMVGNLIQALPGLLQGIIPMLLSAIDLASAHAGEIVTMGLNIVVQLGKGIINSLPNILQAIGGLLKNVGQAIASYNWVSLGQQIIQGLINGIKSLGSALKNAFGGIVESGVNHVKGFLGIESPSKLFAYYGRMVDEGLASGLEKNTGIVSNAFNGMMGILDAPAPVLTAQTLQFATPSGSVNPISMTLNFEIDNSGKDITDDDVNRWANLLTDRIDDNLGRRYGI